jgi:hypothetical protein
MSTEQQLVTFNEMQLDANNARERDILITEREFAVAQRKANALASSNIVPKQFQGNIANCMIAMEMANRLHTGDMEIMQNLYIVHGNPAFSSKYLIALVNKSGVIKGRLKFRFVGNEQDASWGCQAYATCAETGEELVGTTITIQMANAEGWSTKQGSKWKTMPEQMLMYRAASFWSRIYAPDAIMGMHSREELEDIEEKDITPAATTASSVASSIKPKQEIQDAEVIQSAEATEDAPTEEPASQQETEAPEPVEPTQDEIENLV